MASASATRNLVHGVPAERLPLSRDEILHHLRGLQERRHREAISIHSGHYNWMYWYRCSLTDLDESEMDLKQANDCCNRAAPFYILQNTEKYSRVESLMANLHNYLYQRWFRPYHSEIEYGQFLAKAFLIEETSLPRETCSQSIVDLTRALNASICKKVDQAQNSLKACTDAEEDDDRGGLDWTRNLTQVIRDQDFFILQPLFRAVAVAIRAEHFDSQVADIPIECLSVLVIRTGVEDGLSAPIIFDLITEDLRKDILLGSDGKISAVETTLKSAVDFLLGLEQREVMAFGLRPDPIESTRNLESGFLGQWGKGLLCKAKDLGWNEDWEPLEGPSSSWVDTEKHPTWSGPGADIDNSMTLYANRWRELVKY